jgi:hypothetical protein
MEPGRSKLVFDSCQGQWCCWDCFPCERLTSPKSDTKEKSSSLSQPPLVTRDRNPTAPATTRPGPNYGLGETMCCPSCADGGVSRPRAEVELVGRGGLWSGSERPICFRFRFRFYFSLMLFLHLRKLSRGPALFCSALPSLI